MAPNAQRHVRCRLDAILARKQHVVKRNTSRKKTIGHADMPRIPLIAGKLNKAGCRESVAEK